MIASLSILIGSAKDFSGSINRAVTSSNFDVTALRLLVIAASEDLMFFRRSSATDTCSIVVGSSMSASAA